MRYFSIIIFQKLLKWLFLSTLLTANRFKVLYRVRHMFWVAFQVFKTVWKSNCTYLFSQATIWFFPLYLDLQLTKYTCVNSHGFTLSAARTSKTRETRVLELKGFSVYILVRRHRLLIISRALCEQFRTNSNLVSLPIIFGTTARATWRKSYPLLMQNSSLQLKCQNVESRLHSAFIA